MELTEQEHDTGGSLVPGTATVLEKGENLPPVLRGFYQLPKNKQIGFIATAALTLAMIAAVILWSQHTEYEKMYTGLPEKEAGEVMDALNKLNTDYEIDRTTGAILVPKDKVAELRLKLATQGLPREADIGYENLEKETSFGSSQGREQLRFQHALEAEIARSIMTIRGVRSARVHLALPKESVFVRNPKKSSASVVVDLSNAYGLEPGQVEGIVHLVAASVPQLEPSQVNVVDSRGHLLNSRDSASGMNLTAKQFDYRKQMEDHLIERVENILSPVVGADGMRTQVTADIDFDITERTQEVYNPDQPALRSEQSTEELNKQSNPAQGVPGALTNQPPAAGTAPETTGQNAQAGAGGQAGNPQNQSSSKSATRNFELDKTISTTHLGSGGVRRLTVAVVVDHRRVLQPDGTYTSQPYSDEDLTRFTSLAKEAVGFDVARGDRVTVTNAAFRGEVEVPSAPVWEQPWFWSVSKQAFAALVVLLLILGVLRPAVKGLVSRDEEARKAAAEAALAAAAPGSPEALAAAEALGLEGPGTGGGDALGLGSPDDLLLLESPQSYEKRLEFAQQTIDKDPKRVAQVIKLWMTPGAQTNG